MTSHGDVYSKLMSYRGPGRLRDCAPPRREAACEEQTPPKAREHAPELRPAPPAPKGGCTDQAVTDYNSQGAAQKLQLPPCAAKSPPRELVSGCSAQSP